MRLRGTRLLAGPVGVRQIVVVPPSKGAEELLCAAPKMLASLDQRSLKLSVARRSALSGAARGPDA